MVKIPRNKLDDEDEKDGGQKRRRMAGDRSAWRGNSQNSNVGTPKGANDEDGFGITNSDDDDEEDSGQDEATNSRDDAARYDL